MTMTIGGTSGLVFPDSSTQNTAATGFGFKNRIINGAMMIDQRNAGASVTISTSNTYTLDRWFTSATQASKFSVQQGNATNPAGFPQALVATSLSAYSITSSDLFVIRQKIEGFNIADLAWGSANAAPVTLSFWVRSSLTGTFGGSFLNSAQNRSYPFSYTINAANTWEQKSITVAGDTTGTWLTTNGTGIDLFFGLGVGSTSSGTAGSWSGSTFYSATGATSVVGTNGATFYITGVQLEKGSTATSFDYRPYGTELALCQRYYYRLNAEATGSRFAPLFCDSTTSAVALMQLPVSMRTSPSALDQSGTAGNYTVIAGSTIQTCNAVPTLGGATVQTAVVVFNVASGLTTGQSGQSRAANASAYLGFSAEL